MINSAIVTKKQLQNILSVSYPTALKQYRTILDSLELKRNFLTQNDLKNYGLL